MEEFLRFVLPRLVEYPDDVVISTHTEEDKIMFRLRMRKSDVGKVIGRNGLVIKALRQLLNVSAHRQDRRAFLDLDED